MTRRSYIVLAALNDALKDTNIIQTIKDDRYVDSKRHIAVNMPGGEGESSHYFPICGTVFKPYLGKEYVPLMREMRVGEWLWGTRTTGSYACYFCGELVDNWRILQKALADDELKLLKLFGEYITRRQVAGIQLHRWLTYFYSQLLMSKPPRPPLKSGSMIIYDDIISASWKSDWYSVKQPVKVKQPTQLPPNFKFDEQKFFHTINLRLPNKAYVKCWRFSALQKDYTVCELMAWDPKRHDWVKATGITHRNDPDKWNYQHGKFYSAQNALKQLREMLRKGIPTKHPTYLQADYNVEPEYED